VAVILTTSRFPFADRGTFQRQLPFSRFLPNIAVQELESGRTVSPSS
jgi:hypothetical protein